MSCYASCWHTAVLPRDPNADVLVIGAYSVVREVLHDGLMPAFAREWKQRTGRPVTFEESYNASGAQARAIASGFDADVAILSHEGDMELLVKAARVKPTWKDGPSKGVVTHSLVVIGHRPGNPKSIKGWADLANPGVGVLYPDPKTSGGARWNINAIYGSAYLSSREANNGQPNLGSIRDFMARIQANVVNMDQSGRQSMANFAERGTGDVVVTYENELLFRNKDHDPIPYVIPSATLLIESPAAVVETAALVARHQGGGRGFRRVPFVRCRAADRGGIRVQAGEAGIPCSQWCSAITTQALYDGRPGGMGQNRGTALRAQRAVDFDICRQHG